MSEAKRFVAIDYEEVYYITDTDGLKTLDDFIKEFSKPEYEFTEDEILSAANEAYWEMIYENSMTAKENVDKLNELYENNQYLQGKGSSWKITASEEMVKQAELVKENVRLKQQNKMLRTNVGKLTDDVKYL